ncbi:MAG: ABC transporter permease [Clostridia bacterium]|nr:ABC transporter permease [Clostridia bacterium]
MSRSLINRKARFFPLKKRSANIRAKLLPVGAFCLIVLIWWGLSASGIIPGYMLPSPADVVGAFIHDFPNLMHHAFVSVTEALLGLLIGTAFAFGLACVMERFLTLEQAVMPLLVVTQTIPTIAIAPLLVLWMGFGMEPKIMLVVITTFFPIAVGLLDGFKSADPDAVALLRSMNATRGQIFRHVKMPAALPYFFSGLRISASYAVVGAVISEWLGGFEGLGVYMTRVRKAYAFDKMFAVILLIVIVSLLLMKLVNVIRDLSMPWLRYRTEETGRALHE